MDEDRRDSIRVEIVLPWAELERLKTEFLDELKAAVGENTGDIPEKTLTSREAAEFLGCSVKHLHNLRRNHRISSCQDGRKITFQRKDLQAYLDAHRQSMK